MNELSIRTSERCCLIDITREVSRVINNSGIKSGIATLFVPHTTASITINENADPDVKTDILMKLDKIVDSDMEFRHSEGNSAAHLKAVMTGFSVSVIIEDGVMQLGTWQGIYLCEYDGPRTRKVYIKTMG
ncbi:MAG TPA: secondary thiamine-phosphate synthase enzyme YjbQ [Clostridia bacterium]|mgnify:FL=1|nr:secondary thiamine-phosphate synthase enzyme YjbQ [Clostridia bacterium]